jgi:16S rRNA (adenine1518-N6/adenine1519-N6)-dimethyltransferase
MYEAIKKLGQNFLTDITYAQDMVYALNISSGDSVIEIGPGLGVITEQIVGTTVNKDFTLTAVEVDSRFLSKLNTMFASYPNVHVVNEDILKFLPEFTTTTELKIIGALPFYITSPIVHAIVKMQKMPSTVVLLVQKEVGKKIANAAPDGSYISTFVQTFYDVEYLKDVPRQVFQPEPAVDGAILVLHKKAQVPVLDVPTIEKYEGFLHRVFNTPRKMLNKVFSLAELQKIGIDPTLRPEAVPAEKWFESFKILNS